MKTRNTDQGIIRPPVACECGRVGSLALFEVKHIPSGQRRTGPFSQFGKIIGRNRHLVLKEYFQYLGWLVECVECRYNHDDKGMIG